jgi:hypothetical protein
MGFDPCDCTLKIWESFWDSNSQHGSSLGNVRVHSFTLFALLGTCEVTPGSPSWPATFQPLTLVTSPRLGLQQVVIQVDIENVFYHNLNLGFTSKTRFAKVRAKNKA